MQDAKTVFEVFRATADATPEAPFLIVPSDLRRSDGVPTLVSYAAARLEVERLAELYAAAGYEHGHRIAQLLGNTPEFFYHYLALNALGVSIVPINPDYRYDEIRYLLEHSEALLAVVTPESHAAVSAAAKGLEQGDIPVIIGTNTAAFLPPRTNSPPPRRSMPANLETECALLYTSGTTGRPKGCILTNHYFVTAGRGYVSHGGLMSIRQGQERFYNPLPLYHMNHLAVTATGAILTGNALVMTPRFSPSRWWAEIVETGATVIHYLGVVVATLMNQPPSALDSQHKVRFGVGAGVEPELHGAFETRFGFPLLEVWGMTETGRIYVANEEPRLVDTRAFGRPFAGFEAMVADAEGRPVPAGSDGELLVRHSPDDPRHGFFSGYLKNEAATDEVWRGGWFHTGDVVRQDETGMLYFVDRMKNIIRRSGENIAAAEVEAVLQAHEAVAQVAVLAAPDEVREEEVFACVVTMPGLTGDSALAEALVHWCRVRLAYYKVPGWVLFVDKLPTTGTQKVQKTQIFTPGEDPCKRPDAFDLRGLKRRVLGG